MGRYYPVNLDVRGKKCLVVGGGEVALRKARALLDAGAELTVVAPDIHPKLRSLAGAGLEERPFRDTDLHGAFVVVVATSDAIVNRTVARDAADFGCLVNVVDCPALSSFTVPAKVRRGELLVAISTGGECPSLARRIREELEERFGEEYADFVAVLGEVRRDVLDKVPDAERRVKLLRELTDTQWLEVLRTLGRDGLRSEMLKFLAEGPEQGQGGG